MFDFKCINLFDINLTLWLGNLTDNGEFFKVPNHSKIFFLVTPNKPNAYNPVENYIPCLYWVLKMEIVL